MNTQKQRATTTIWCGTEPDLPTVQIAMQIATWTAQETYLITKTTETVIAQLATGHNVILIEGDVSSDNWQLIGYAASYFLAEVAGVPYWELGTVIINPARRHTGIGTHLYDAIEALHEQVGGVLCGTTKDLRVVRIGLLHGLTVVPFASLPDAVLRPLCHEASCFHAQVRDARRCLYEQENGGGCHLRCRHAYNS